MGFTGFTSGFGKSSPSFYPTFSDSFAVIKTITASGVVSSSAVVSFLWQLGPTRAPRVALGPAESNLTTVPHVRTPGRMARTRESSLAWGIWYLVAIVDYRRSIVARAGGVVGFALLTTFHDLDANQPGYLTV